MHFCWDSFLFQLKATNRSTNFSERMNSTNSMIGDLATTFAMQTPQCHDMRGSVVGFLRGQEMGSCLHGRVFGSPCYTSSVRQVARHAVPRCIAKEADRFPSESSYDKVFSSRWLNSSTVCFGTKDSKIVTWSHRTGEVAEYALPAAEPCQADPAIPAPERHVPFVVPDCARVMGVHSIDLNPSGSCLVATGREEGDVTLFATDSMSPVTVLRGHSSCVFGTRFISDSVLLSAGRDGLLLAWDLSQLPGSLDSFTPYDADIKAKVEGSSCCPVAPIGSTLVYQSISRIRALEYDASTHTALALDGPFGVVVIDCDAMLPTRSIERPPVDGLVALAHSAEHHVFAAGSLEGTLVYDLRTDRSHEVTRVGLPAGVRSLAFSGDVLAIGGGDGAVDFYDVRMLDHCCAQAFTCSDSARSRIVADGYLFGSGPQAVYTLQFDPVLQSKLFVGGGPLLCGSRGSYASVWE